MFILRATAVGLSAYCAIIGAAVKMKTTNKQANAVFIVVDLQGMKQAIEEATKNRMTYIA
jgi:hypothetical protein